MFDRTSRDCHGLHLHQRHRQGDQIIKGALADHCHKTNPRIASAQDYEEMLAASM